MITVLGGGGFVGSHLVRHLSRLGLDHQVPERGEPLAGRELGHIIYCIGLTGDFRERTCEGVEAHVGSLVDVIRRCSFESLLYLSSARVYLGGSSPAREEDPLRFRPQDENSRYGLSKAAGEALVLSLGRAGKIARLSNVYGKGHNDRFLKLLLEQASRERTITLSASMESVRDYVSVADVSDLLVKIALDGRHRIYNVASGRPVRNAELVDAVCAATGCRPVPVPAAPIIFPTIDIERIRTEFDFTPADILQDLPELLGEAAQ